MRVLIAFPDPKYVQKTLQFSAQLVCHLDEPPTVLKVVRDPSEDALPRLESILAETFAAPAPCQCQVKLRVGTPLDEILNEASEGDYDLIILGEQSAHKLDRYLRGNFPLRVAEQAQCPVLFVKGEARTIQRLLVCDSGGGQPSLLSRFTAKLAELLEGEEEITVLHVMSQISAGPGVSGKHLRAEAEELIHERTLEGNLLQRDIEELTKPGIHARPKVRHGLVEDEILKEAQGSDYDLVVIGMYQGHDLKRFLLEDHTGKLLSHLDRPVLVVK